MFITNLRKFRAALFWRLFANYLIVILVPVIVASMLAHFLVVRTIEKDAEKLNDVIMSHFSEQTDTALNGLKVQMINMLSLSNVSSLLRMADETRDNPQRTEQVFSLREQLTKLQADALVSKAYMVLAERDLVVDVDIYTDKGYFFNRYFPLPGGDTQTYLANFRGKKMMDFLEQDPYGLSAVMSYPFNSDKPEVYLVVVFNQTKLGELIRSPEKWVTGTAIASSTGRILNQSGLSDKEAHAVLDQTRASSIGSQFLVTDESAMSLVKSKFDESWYYATIADMRTLMKPAHMTRLISWAFLVFFVVVGGFVSYYLSRRVYRPIREIADENKELSQRVSGMFPVVQEQFLTKIIQGEYRDELSIEYYAREIQFTYNKLAHRTVLAVAFHYTAEEYDRLSETTKSFLLVELRERLFKSIPSVVWLSRTKPDMLACVVQHDPFLHFGAEEAASIVGVVLESYARYFKSTVGIGKTVQGMGELHESYAQALSVLQYRGLDADVELCRLPEAGERAPWEGFLSVQDVGRILNQVRSREYAPLLDFVLQMLEEGSRKRVTAMQIKSWCTDVLNTWIRAIESEQHDYNGVFFSGLFERVNRCMTWEELRGCFRDIHAGLFRTEEPNARALQFADLLAYIHEHYNEELSIEFFAGQLGMSGGHFSRTFKEEVGEKYVEYIAKYRMKMAKQYLLETDLRIDDIAEKIGYWGRNSFIRTFRKYEGITPAQYRASHQ